ncbi:phosphomannomutase [Paracoccus aurantiacus]|uniref:Phosphomannomutase n=1 Tax=Paracoccus aurantiacus TaxID=2599412 RepID=A0A5C6S7G0_9RHOB|nr:phosphomannomutase [Paracoccus aurantiacus]TXB70451.1 phosphomannomutase [Paracoccus aurantiacus]
MPAALSCFKAYDIRGRLGTDLDAAIARRIGRGFARALDAKKVVLGRDIRASSAELASAVADALIDEGVEVLDLGLAGTEEMYFAVSHFGADGGIEVTASHNPMDYNGMKMVRAGSAPLGSATGLDAVQALAEADDFGPARDGGRLCDISAEARAAYVARLMSFIDTDALRPLRIVVNAGNGAAGPTFDAIADALAARNAPLRFLRIHHEPDGSFPNGIPNPLLRENQPATAEAVRAADADMGIAFDGDFDRCFFFDETGRFVDGEYIVGLLAAAFLSREPGARIVHDPRVIWNTRDIVESAGGVPIQSRTGHAFLKAALREHDAVYGGEMSAHHYFRDFVFCDSGMIPWLLVAELMGRTGQPLSALVAERRAAFPSSGEINFTVENAAAIRDRVEAEFAPDAVGRDDMDGLSLDMGSWRFNLRSSNTEPLLRLNVEARGDRDLLDRQVARLSALIQAGA